jgi:hypothetical protein
MDNLTAMVGEEEKMDDERRRPPHRVRQNSLRTGPIVHLIFKTTINNSTSGSLYTTMAPRTPKKKAPRRE